MRRKTDIILEWYQNIWIQLDLDRIDEFYRPAARDDCLVPGGVLSSSDVRELALALNNLVSDQRVRVIHAVEDGKWVSALMEMYGFRPGTDRSVYMRWMAMMRFEDDRIVESYPSVNYVRFFEQLEQLPKNSFELLLTGTVLR